MNDPHETVLEKYFWDFVDRGDAPADTPLFTGIHDGEPLAGGYRAGIRPSAARSRIRHRDRPEGGRAMNRDIYQAITERFIEQLKRGTVPWQKPWFAVQNIVSRKPYRGINALLLGSDGLSIPVLDQLQAGARPWRPCQEGREIHAGHLLQDPRKAGRSRERDRAARTAGQPAFRSSGGRMFSISTRPKASRRPRSQPVRTLPQPLEKAAAIVENARLCPIHHAGFAACYSPKDDVIRIPAPSTFHSQEDYYHTLYHEMIHAIGPHLPSEPGGCHAAGEIWFGAVFQGGADCANSERRSCRTRPAFWTRSGSRTRRPTSPRGFRSSKTIPGMIVSAASQAQRASDFIMGIEHKESLQECQISPEGMPLTWAREHGIDTRIPGFAHRDQDGDGVSTLMEWKHGTRPTDRLSRPPHRQSLSL